MKSIKKQFKSYFPICCDLLGESAWEKLLELFDEPLDQENFSEQLTRLKTRIPIPDYLPEVARLEWIRHRVSLIIFKKKNENSNITLNPTLEVVQIPWTVTHLFKSSKKRQTIIPKFEQEWAMIWQDPISKVVSVESADELDLLALKLIVEEINPKKLTSQQKIMPGQINRAINQAIRKGILITPSTPLHRSVHGSPIPSHLSKRFMEVKQFTLQWHITHACDLHCRHCYDRSKRSALTLKQSIDILKQLEFFCQENHIQTHICFTGGNPFLYPHFFNLYKKTYEMGFSTSILGNPVSRQMVKDLQDIQTPDYYQVSLEGLEDYNDWIRGKGNFYRVIEFLGILRDLHITSAVMLTLNRENMDQILPLAERLRGHVDHFTFNRLSQVGEGAKLQLPIKEDYIAFLRKYVTTSQENPIIGMKDNLINIIRVQEGLKPFGGCTGFGCGAAFNFLAILPDGEVHACRKFPSPVGNILQESLMTIYQSESAQRYRLGSEACNSCQLRLVCGGCMAVVHGAGLNIYRDRDPYCFLEESDMRDLV